MVFLCPYGDRPHEMKPLIALFTSYNESETYGLEVSPPTRGWSLDIGAREVGLEGFPAHAGMVPSEDRAIPGRTRFPRPRGDGPVANGLRAQIEAVSPPTRGWSPTRRGAGATAGGFPAHA